MCNNVHKCQTSFFDIYGWANERTFMSSWVWNVSKILMKSVSSAPEVLSGGPYNHTADWWSLGILLFALATGKVRTKAHIFAYIVFFCSLWEKWHVCVCVMCLFCQVILNSPSLLSFQCPQNRITVACWGGYAASRMRCQKTSLLLLLCCLQRWDLDTWWGALLAKMFKVVFILSLKFPKNLHKWDQ